MSFKAFYKNFFQTLVVKYGVKKISLYRIIALALNPTPSPIIVLN